MEARVPTMVIYPSTRLHPPPALPICDCPFLFLRPVPSSFWTVPASFCTFDMMLYEVLVYIQAIVFADGVWEKDAIQQPEDIYLLKVRGAEPSSPLL